MDPLSDWASSWKGLRRISLLSMRVFLGAGLGYSLTPAGSMDVRPGPGYVCSCRSPASSCSGSFISLGTPTSRWPWLRAGYLPFGTHRPSADGQGRAADNARAIMAGSKADRPSWPTAVSILLSGAGAALEHVQGAAGASRSVVEQHVGHHEEQDAQSQHHLQERHVGSPAPAATSRTAWTP